MKISLASGNSRKNSSTERICRLGRTRFLLSVLVRTGRRNCIQRKHRVRSRRKKEREDVIRGIYLHVDQSSKEFMCRSRKQACSSSAKCPNTLRISGSLCFLEGSGKSRKQIIKLEHRHSRQRKTHPIGCKGRLNSHVSSMRLMRVN